MKFYICLLTCSRKHKAENFPPPINSHLLLLPAWGCCLSQGDLPHLPHAQLHQDGSNPALKSEQ